MLALVVTVPASEAELASDALWALGVSAVEERWAPGDDEGTEDRFVELWTSLGDDVDAVTRAAGAFPQRWRWRTATLDPAVAESWRAHAVPSWVDADLVIVPAWQDDATPPGVLRIDIVTERRPQLDEVILRRVAVAVGRSLLDRRHAERPQRVARQLGLAGRDGNDDGQHQSSRRSVSRKRRLRAT